MIVSASSASRILNTLGRGEGLVDAEALHGKPAVLVDRHHAGMHTDFVSLDNAAAMKAACGHLVDGGYRELLYITEPLKGVSSRRERTARLRRLRDGARVARGRRGVRIHGRRQRWPRRRAAGAAQARETRQRAAVLAGNAIVTLRVAAAMARLGLSFGTDIGFVGFDDPEWAPLIGPDSAPSRNPPMRSAEPRPTA